jgi:hypothetical protein
MPHRSRSLAIALATALAGCQPQTDPSYAGEPALTVGGVVLNAGGAPVNGVEPTLVWAIPDADFEAIEAKRVVVRHTTFEGRFELVVLTEPPASARYPFGRGRNTPADSTTTTISIGFIGARDGSHLAAVAPNHVVAFLEQDAAPGSCAERFLGAALPAGFHLLRGENRTYQQAIAERTACTAAIATDAPPETLERESRLCLCATRVQARLVPVPATESVPLGFGAKPLNVFELANNDITQERVLPEQ